MLRHTAVVKQVNSNSLIVSIINATACSGCSAKSGCAVSDLQEKDIEITGCIKRNYLPGEHVTVIFKEISGFKALFLGYLMPFLLLMVVLFTVNSITGNEIMAAFAGLAILAPYYGVLYWFRDALKKVFTFELEEN